MLNKPEYSYKLLYTILYSFKINIMDAITYTHARANLAKTIENVCDDHSPVIVTKSRDRSVVIISLEDYQALEETAYLLRSPANARRLLEAMNQLDTGGGAVRELVE